MSDLLFQNFSTVQSEQQSKPGTIAAAATISPQSFMTFVTGSTAVQTITPPVTGQHMLVLVFTATNAGTMLTTGNILTAVVPTEAVPTLLFYDPVQRKYYGSAGNVT